ncbi:hypothetical protein BDZ45DRAFT_442547 [Acephala macrosclerotiorum]|nr:hypothetical protein BDZ45DRAFT_442547 [Acephala macrosclerotiorum]
MNVEECERLAAHSSSLINNRTNRARFSIVHYLYWEAGGETSKRASYWTEFERSSYGIQRSASNLRGAKALFSLYNISRWVSSRFIASWDDRPLVSAGLSNSCSSYLSSTRIRAASPLHRLPQFASTFFLVPFRVKNYVPRPSSFPVLEINARLSSSRSSVPNSS